MSVVSPPPVREPRRCLEAGVVAGDRVQALDSDTGIWHPGGIVVRPPYLHDSGVIVVDITHEEEWFVARREGRPPGDVVTLDAEECWTD